MIFTLQQFSLDEPSFKSKKSRKRMKDDDQTSLDIMDDEELEHLQSDAEEDEEKDEEGAIASDPDDEDMNVKGVSFEPLYVLPLYAILSSDKQSRVCSFCL